jgi:hypothetical protein
MLLGALAGLMALNQACGSSGPGEQTTPVCMGPPTESCILAVDGHPFVHAAGTITDGVSTGKVRHAGGRFCLSGRLDPGPTNANWGAFLALFLTHGDAQGIPAPFDAPAFGITQVQLTIEQPPVAGLVIQLSAVQRADCLAIPDCLTPAPFELADGNGDQMIVEEPGTITAPFTSFVQPSWGDASLAFDPSLVATMRVVPLTLPGVVLDYDFCVRDVRFLDGGGRVVAP